MALMTSAPGSSAPLRGILLMLSGGAFLTANDAVLKWLTAGYPVGQLMFVRGLFVFIPILVFVYFFGGFQSLKVKNPKVHAFRGLLVIAGTFQFVTGLKYLPIADCIAIAFAGPLFVTALAPAMIGEKVGWRRWSAVLAGFAGVLIILRPGTEAMHAAALLPLGAAFTGSLRDLLTRAMASRETSNAMLATTTLAVTLAGLATYPFTEWAPVKTEDMGLMLLSGCLLGGAHWLIIESFRFGEAALLSPFKYTNLIFAVALGYVIWGDLPDQWTWVGTAVVIVSGLYILHREARVRQVAGKA